MTSIPEWLAPLIAWLTTFGASARAFSIVVFGYTLGAAAIFTIVLVLIIVGVIGLIVFFGMRSKNPTEW